MRGLKSLPVFALVVLGPVVAWAGSFASLREEGRLLVVEMETSTGEMTNPQDETRHLAAWKKRTAPVMLHHKGVLEEELSRVAGVLKLPVVPFSKGLPVVWEEGVDSAAMARHEKSGGGPCTVRWRLWPGQRVDVLVSFSQLPTQTQRTALKAALEDVLRRHPYVTPGEPTP